MRIVVDFQGAQSSGSRQRGIGRYSTWLTKALLQIRGQHEVLLAVSDAFGEAIDEIRSEFHGLLPQENIRVWSPVGPTAHVAAQNEWNRRSAELLREAFLASLEPDVVLVTSLMEGLIDNAVTSVGRFARLPTAVVLYDLIPLVHDDIYLKDAGTRAWYEGKLDDMRRADLLLAISQSSRDEGIRYLGRSSEDCISISTATDPSFRPVVIAPATERQLRSRYGLARQFVMYTGGIDHRKNIEGLLRAFASLPSSLRDTHQLAVVCAIHATDRERLGKLMGQLGLGKDQVVFTGFIPEADLVALYNLCKLFVFPSWHEGFGLPALEAMACGRATIAADSSSLPEVIGDPEALFDAHDDAAMARTIERFLNDPLLRKRHERRALTQAARFSWNATAQRALAALEQLHARKKTTAVKPMFGLPARRLRLAYVSPLPPERSGISDYSAELLPQLRRYFDIELVAAQSEVSPAVAVAGSPVRSVDWFLRNSHRFDRVVYHLGNSVFHLHMFSLIEQVPGVVVLHDFYLGHVMEALEGTGRSPGAWTRALYESHGSLAAAERFLHESHDVVWKYPCSRFVFEQAIGVVVHSHASVRLAEDWYGAEAARRCAVIPLLRQPAGMLDRKAARRALNLPEDAFVVCSFGLLGPTKLNDRLLDAWLSSTLSALQDCYLIFVGDNHPGDYGRSLQSRIAATPAAARVRITGWTDAKTYRLYLHGADAAVQLRSLSRGETSAAVLDCMNHELATIVNSHGSLADLPDDMVVKVPDDFDDRALSGALEALYENGGRRVQIGQKAREHILSTHSPKVCAEQYLHTIERFYQAAENELQALNAMLARLDEGQADPRWWSDLARAEELAFRPRPTPARQLLVDVSELVHHDAGTGIQRVVRNILEHWLCQPMKGFRVEPVYAEAGRAGYRYARNLSLRMLQAPAAPLPDAPISFGAGDVFVGLDFQPFVIPAQRSFYRQMMRHGVTVKFVVYDLLSLSMPEHFPEGAEAAFQRWLEVVAESDGAICISRAVAEELPEWLARQQVVRRRPLPIDWFHLGADLPQTATIGTSLLSAPLRALLEKGPTFLMVGTLEPRKGHADVLQAFEATWARGSVAKLVIVGKEGWKSEKLAGRIRNHAERGRLLHWFERVSDADLARLYGLGSALIAASLGEGFGLPVIEAQLHGLPVIARDIPVFREVASEDATFFRSERDLSLILQSWGSPRVARDTKVRVARLTWQQSAEALAEAVFSPLHHAQWEPDEVLRFSAGDYRLKTEVGIRDGARMRSDGRKGFLVYGPFQALARGTYSVSIWGSAGGAGLQQAYADVVTDHGAIRLAAEAISPGQGGQAEVARLLVRLDAACRDLEVRVWTPDDADISLSGIEIAPAPEDLLTDVCLPQQPGSPSSLNGRVEAF
ncbi:glycosyltransferase [Ideonella sp. BN130291]|uniref:glycosyltransferase n=1 Tax=Ideonella sp. BN130291 TaxID=3112940 RepID=UPI002E26A9B6|nr:glycosyltransferase [Ideonella sp. BN130291]